MHVGLVLEYLIVQKKWVCVNLLVCAWYHLHENWNKKMHKPDGPNKPVYVFVWKRGVKKTCLRKCECGINMQLYGGVCYCGVKINFRGVGCEHFLTACCGVGVGAWSVFVLAHVGEGVLVKPFVLLLISTHFCMRLCSLKYNFSYSSLSCMYMLAFLVRSK